MLTGYLMKKQPCSVLISVDTRVKKVLFQLSCLNYKSITQLYLSGVALNKPSNVLYQQVLIFNAWTQLIWHAEWHLTFKSTWNILH